MTIFKNFIIWSIIWTGMFVILITTRPLYADNEKTYDELVDYVIWFHQDAPNRIYKSLIILPKVIEISEKYNVDPMLVSVIIGCETSWRPNVVGKLGERGLMQTHGVAAHGYNLRTIRGQISAGTSWLSIGIKKCGMNARALAWYNGDGCANKKYAQRRWRKYQKAIAMFRRK